MALRQTATGASFASTTLNHGYGTMVQPAPFATDPISLDVAVQRPTILSYNEWKVDALEETLQYLAETSIRRDTTVAAAAECDEAKHPELQCIDVFLKALKTPPKTSVFRVNKIKGDRQKVIQDLQKHMNEWMERSQSREFLSCDIHAHDIVPDIVTLRVTVTTAGEGKYHNLSNCRIPPVFENNNNQQQQQLFSSWPLRRQQGWPLTHRVVICDRLCGEAVLRGSDIFVKGILVADQGVTTGEAVAVYAHMETSASAATRNESSQGGPHKVHRGMLLESYHGTCFFLGLGTSACQRSDYFRQSQGVAIFMSPLERAGPILPPLSGILHPMAFLQNLPSVVVGHVLDPQPNDMILDMCAAPGGKTSHVASLVGNQATIVACDKSRTKILQAKQLFDTLGCTCITPLALDATSCVDQKVPWRSVTAVRNIFLSLPISPRSCLSLTH